jgi:hypothetical protein
MKHMRSNGLTLEQVTTTTVIGKILLGLYQHDRPLTKKYILRRILGKTLNLRTSRGYFSNYFAEAREQGLLKYDRVTQTWRLTCLGERLAVNLNEWN